MAVDVDIENTDEFEKKAVQDRVLGVLKIVKQNKPWHHDDPHVRHDDRANFWGTRLINRAAALRANIDVCTIMPFDFGGGANLFQNTVNASEGLKTAFGWSDDTAYRHMGISGMNGLSDQQELTSVQTWTQIRDWGQRPPPCPVGLLVGQPGPPCPGGGVRSDCSGIAQGDWKFTRITARFTG